MNLDEITKELEAKLKTAKATDLANKLEREAGLWRATDNHTGIARADYYHGFYTYEHTEPITEKLKHWYKIETVVAFVNIPWHKDIYYIPAYQLRHFIAFQHKITKITTITKQEALDELYDFKTKHSSV